MLFPFQGNFESLVINFLCHFFSIFVMVWSNALWVDFIESYRFH